MPSPDIEEFAKILVQQIRDEAIGSNDRDLHPEARSLIARRWRKSGFPPEAIAMVIPDVVDTAIFCLLQAIDEGQLRLKFIASSGREVDLTTDGQGELAGWYLGSDGWLEKYAKERYANDLAYLDQWPPGQPPDDDEDE
jgi:hypothetical protein